MNITTSVRFIARAAAIVLAAGLSLSVRAGTVVIIEGHDPDATTNTGIHAIGSIAEANYLAKGYTIKRVSNQGGAPGKADTVMKINMAGVNALVFAGHGTSGASRIVLDYPTGGDDGKAILPGDLTGDYSGIKHVEMQACDQDQPGWNAKFPNANVDAWTGSVTVDGAKNDAKHNAPSRIPVKSPPTTGSAALKPDIDARIRNRIAMMTMAQDGNPAGYMCGNWTQLNWQLQPTIGSLFGTHSFNISTIGLGGPLVLRGLTVSGGHVVSEVDGGYGVPEFTLQMDWQAFDLAMQNIDSLGGMLGGPAMIVGNVSGVPDTLAYQAAAGVYFGFNAIPAPGASALLGLGCVIAFSRRRSA